MPTGPRSSTGPRIDITCSDGGTAKTPAGKVVEDTNRPISEQVIQIPLPATQSAGPQESFERCKQRLPAAVVLHLPNPNVAPYPLLPPACLCASIPFFSLSLSFHYQRTIGCAEIEVLHKADHCLRWPKDFKPTIANRDNLARQPTPFQPLCPAPAPHRRHG